MIGCRRHVSALECDSGVVRRICIVGGAEEKAVNEDQGL